MEPFSLHAYISEHQGLGGLRLDVVVRESGTVLELLFSEDEALLIGKGAFLVLDLGLHAVDGVRELDLEVDVLAADFISIKGGAGSCKWYSGKRGKRKVKHSDGSGSRWG